MTHITERAISRGTVEGIDWLTAPAPLYGAINGYARIPEDHPWHGKNYDEIDVDAHGGLTYGSDKEGWVGFDTLHLGDYWPGIPFGAGSGDIEWDEPMVAEETKKLAAQIAKAGA